jgi:CRP/FNR family cyclic AMP-dependent transcriptional regulator
MQTTAETLAGVKLFEQLSLEQRKEVAAHCELHQFAKGQEIVHERDPTKDVYFVVSGKVRATILSRSGKEVSFRDIAASEVFGDLAALDGMPRSSSVVALADSSIVSMSASNFWMILHNYPSVSAATLIGLTDLIRKLSARVVEFSTLGVKNRIHAELLRLARAQHCDGNSANIAPAPTHAEISARISSNREAVTRELNHLEAVGLIERAGGSIVVVDVARLSRMVEDVKGAES